MVDEIKKDDKILFWDINCNLLLYSFIKYTKCDNLNLWYWNSLTLNKLRLKILNFIKKFVNCYTFDSDDAEKYELNLKNQLCYDVTKYKVAELDEKSDIYFVGIDKHRANKIISFYKIAKYNNLKLDFNIIKDSNDSIPDELLAMPFTFEENIRHLKSTRCVLEILKEGQRGISMRTLEALLLHKKLITDNKSIIYEDFYTPDNIFVLGIDNIDKLKEFVFSDSVNDNITIDKFLINNWVQSFM
jgi:hypothetical protein